MEWAPWRGVGRAGGATTVTQREARHRMAYRVGTNKEVVWMWLDLDIGTAASHNMKNKNKCLIVSGHSSLNPIITSNRDQTPLGLARLIFILT
jgi:hypothetical protein